MMSHTALTGVLMAQVRNHIAVLQRGKKDDRGSKERTKKMPLLRKFAEILGMELRCNRRMLVC